MELLLPKPESGKADEVGSKGRKMLLEAKCLRGADLEMMHLEDVFAFLDAGLNRLTTIIPVKPLLQVEGIIKGEITAQGPLRIGPGGVLEAEIRGTAVVVRYSWSLRQLAKNGSLTSLPAGSCSEQAESPRTETASRTAKMRILWLPRTSMMIVHP